MSITYDREADAAYIYLVPKELARRVANTYACDPQEVKGQIQLDFDESGQLIGIEVLDASRLLPEEVLVGAASTR